MLDLNPIRSVAPASARPERQESADDIIRRLHKEEEEEEEEGNEGDDVVRSRKEGAKGSNGGGGEDDENAVPQSSPSRRARGGFGADASPGAYPPTRALASLLAAWPPSDADAPPASLHAAAEPLWVLNYSAPAERARARRLRDAELPFKLVGVPEIDAAVAVQSAARRRLARRRRIDAEFDALTSGESSDGGYTDEELDDLLGKPARRAPTATLAPPSSKGGLPDARVALRAWLLDEAAGAGVHALHVDKALAALAAVLVVPQLERSPRSHFYR